MRIDDFNRPDLCRLIAFMMGVLQINIDCYITEYIEMAPKIFPVESTFSRRSLGGFFYARNHPRHTSTHEVCITFDHPGRDISRRRDIRHFGTGFSRRRDVYQGDETSVNSAQVYQVAETPVISTRVRQGDETSIISAQLYQGDETSVISARMHQEDQRSKRTEGQVVRRH